MSKPKYYTKDGDKYTIIKCINRHRYNFGTYPTEDEAQERVEFLKQHNWNTLYSIQPRQPKYYHKCKGKYSITKTINNTNYSYGTYQSEEAAKKQVEFLKQHQWNPKYSKTIVTPKYYHKYKNKWKITRKINGITYIFGSYNDEQDAIKQVEFLEQTGWNLKYAQPRKGKPKYPRYIEKRKNKYVVRRCIDGHNKYFGRYYELEDAIQRRDELIKCNWQTKAIGE